MRPCVLPQIYPRHISRANPPSSNAAENGDRVQHCLPPGFLHFLLVCTSARLRAAAVACGVLAFWTSAVAPFGQAA